MSNTISYISCSRRCSRENSLSAVFQFERPEAIHSAIREFAIAKHLASGQDRNDLEEILHDLCVE